MDLNERDDQQFMLDRIDDQVDTLGRAFMGMTMGCARCHDHKFDPIAQTDYYALAGIFSSTRTLSGQKNKGGGGNYFEPALLAKISSTNGHESPGVRGSEPPKGGTPNLEELRSKVASLSQQVKQKKGKSPALRMELAQARRELLALQQGNPGITPKKKKKGGDGPQVDFDAPLAMAVSEGKVASMALRVRGEPDLHGDIVPRGFPALFGGSEVPAIPEDASGRLQLASWLASPTHPLTARVMVNRVWGHLFGRGIVPTVDNFGLAGEVPTHPELLDHLASRFVAGGWSVKSLLRSIVLSRTYRLSSDHNAECSAKDESNSLYWRMNLRRLEAEAIRDSFLAAAGVLELEPPRGAVFDRQEVAGLFKGGNGGKGSSDGSAILSKSFRSVYLPVFRSRLPGMFTVFDFAEPDQVNGQRDVTTVAPQALFMLNNEFVIDSAQRAARRIVEIPGMSSEASRVDYAYAYTLCRRPTATERSNALAYLESGGGDRAERWGSFLQALFSSAEFRYLR